MPDTALPRSPALLDAAGAAALIASYAAVGKGAALKDIGRIDVHMGRFISLSPLCLVATADASGKQGLQAVELVKTSPSSWGETDLDGLFQRSSATLDDTDTKGPVPIAVVVSADLKQMKTGKEGTARLAVFGSVEFAQNREMEGTYYNRDLLMNTIGWLVGQSDLVSIRPRGVRASRVQFTADQGTVIFYLSVLLIPELLLIAGIAVWWRRE